MRQWRGPKEKRKRKLMLADKEEVRQLTSKRPTKQQKQKARAAVAVADARDGLTARELTKIRDANANDATKKIRLPTVGAEGEEKSGRKQAATEKLLSNEKQEVRPEKVGFKSLAQYCSVEQRKQVTALWNEVSGSMGKMVDTMETVGLEVLENPQENLYKLAVITRAASEYKDAYAKCQDLMEKVELAKLYLLAVTTVGRVLAHVLPNYKVTEAGADEKVTGSLRRFEVLVLFMYRSWLSSHFAFIVADKFFSGEVDHENCEIFANQLCRMLVPLIEAGRSTNFRDELFRLSVDYVLLLQAQPALKEHSNAVIRTFCDIVADDANLSFSAMFVPLVIERFRKSKTSHAVVLFQCFDYINISRKERNLLAEHARRGIETKLLRHTDKVKRSVEAQVIRNQSAGLVTGEYNRFIANKNVILEKLMVMLVRVLRATHLYPAESVLVALRCLSKQAQHINVELAKEIFEELKAMADSCGQKDAMRSGPIIFAAVTAALELLGATGADAEVHIENDVQWIGSALLRAFAQTIPFVDESNQQSRNADDSDAHETDTDAAGRDSSADLAEARISSHREQVFSRVVTQGSISLDEFAQVIKSFISNNRALGVHAAARRQLAKSPKATELYVMLAALTAHVGPSFVTVLDALMRDLLRGFPTLKNVHDQDGLIFDSLTAPQTLVWCKHLASMTLVNSAPKAFQ